MLEETEYSTSLSFSDFTVAGFVITAEVVTGLVVIAVTEATVATEATECCPLLISISMEHCQYIQKW
jgi:hypothetical protein